jgi:hypothetical protein
MFKRLNVTTAIALLRSAAAAPRVATTSPLWRKG